MSSNDDIIKQYQPLIKALIPYQQEGRLLEGLNRFSARLNAKVRTIVKDEVERLTQQSDARADNSDFAQFPVKKFSHFGIDMKLDKVGAEILMRETARYMDQYTVGVFESVMNSDHYQDHIRRELQKKIIKAFTIQVQGYADIQFGDDLAVCPNFSVTSPDYENNRSVSVSSLSKNGIVVESKRSPKFKTGDTLQFTFPMVSGLFKEPTALHYTLQKVSYDSNTQRYNGHFDLAQSNESLRDTIESFLQSVAFRQPLQRELEIERSMQSLDRDRILANSPWIPVFMGPKDNSLVPQMALLTAYNNKRNPAAIESQFLPGVTVYKHLIKEVLKYGEIFVFRAQVKAKGGALVSLCASHRMLEEAGLMGQFVAMANANRSLQIYQYRLKKINRLTLANAMVLQDIDSSAYPELVDLSHILYCRTVTESLGAIKARMPEVVKPFPATMVDTCEPWSLNFIMQEDLDRRSEPRYRIEKQATIKVGLVGSHAATVRDFSVHGMRIELADGGKDFSADHVKVWVPDLKMRGERYTVVDYNPEHRTLRLQLPSEDKNNFTDKVVGSNAGYFKARDIAAQQQRYYRFMWEIASRQQPNVAIQVILGRNPVDRLKTVYLPDGSTDLYPFTAANNVVQLHGFFADMNASPPKSPLLTKLINYAERDAVVVHCIRKQDNRIIAIKHNDFYFTKLRLQIAKALSEDKLEACVSMVECVACEKTTTVMTKQRLVQLSKLDIELFEKLLNLQNVYTHVIHLIDSSALHQSFIANGIHHAKPETRKEAEDSTKAQ